MSDNPTEHVTIVKESGSGSGMFLGIIAAVALAIVAFIVISNQNKVDPTDASISNAAAKVGAAADKVGDAAENAAKPAN